MEPFSSGENLVQFLFTSIITWSEVLLNTDQNSEAYECWLSSQNKPLEHNHLKKKTTYVHMWIVVYSFTRNVSWLHNWETAYLLKTLTTKISWGINWINKGF